LSTASPTQAHPPDEGHLALPFRRREPVSADGAPVTVILPRQPSVFARLGEFVRYRRLTLPFGRRMIQRMYRGTWLGWWWIPLRPTIAVVSQVVIFGGILGSPSGDIPYFLFILVGNVAWDLFAAGSIWATRSLQLGRGVMRKLYVPRLTCLVGGLAPALVYSVVYVIIGVIAVGYYLATDGTTHLVMGPQTVLAPLGALLACLMALSIASYTSVWVLRARDVRFGLTYALGYWFFITPVLYPLEEAPGGLETVLSLNPMTAPIEMARIGMFDVGHLPPTALASCAVGLLAVGISGLIFFNRSEERALDAL
jgi:lipopolysaccharide transport system permease protein